MSLDKFSKKLILITGGNSGIGFATAKLLISLGATIVIAARNKSKVLSACHELGPKAIPFTADVSKCSDLDKLYQFIATEYGMLDGLFINAGVVTVEPFSEVTEQSYDEQMHINLRGAFFTAQKAIPHLIEGASIVMNASLAAHRPFEGGAIYSATKAGVISFTKTMALELAPRKIRINSISPGNIVTPIFDKLGMDEQQKQDFFNSFKERVPLKRSGTSEEVAKTVSFLLSDDSTYTTGADFLIDGGIVLSNS